MGKDRLISEERNVGRVYVSTGQLVVPLRVRGVGIIDMEVDALQLSIRRFESWVGWEAKCLSDLGTEIIFIPVFRVCACYVIKKEG